MRQCCFSNRKTEDTSVGDAKNKCKTAKAYEPLFPTVGGRIVKQTKVYCNDTCPTERKCNIYSDDCLQTRATSLDPCAVKRKLQKIQADLIAIEKYIDRNCNAMTYSCSHNNIKRMKKLCPKRSSSASCSSRNVEEISRTRVSKGNLSRPGTAEPCKRVSWSCVGNKGDPCLPRSAKAYQREVSGCDTCNCSSSSCAMLDRTSNLCRSKTNVQSTSIRPNSCTFELSRRRLRREYCKPDYIPRACSRPRSNLKSYECKTRSKTFLPTLDILKKSSNFRQANCCNPETYKTNLLKVCTQSTCSRLQKPFCPKSRHVRKTRPVSILSSSDVSSDVCVERPTYKPAFQKACKLKSRGRPCTPTSCSSDRYLQNVPKMCRMEPHCNTNPPAAPKPHKSRFWCGRSRTPDPCSSDPCRQLKKIRPEPHSSPCRCNPNSASHRHMLKMPKIRYRDPRPKTSDPCSSDSRIPKKSSRTQLNPTPQFFCSSDTCKPDPCPARPRSKPRSSRKRCDARPFTPCSSHSPPEPCTPELSSRPSSAKSFRKPEPCHQRPYPPRPPCILAPEPCIPELRKVRRSWPCEGQTCLTPKPSDPSLLDTYSLKNSLCSYSSKLHICSKAQRPARPHSRSRSSRPSLCSAEMCEMPFIRKTYTSKPYLEPCAPKPLSRIMSIDEVCPTPCITSKPIRNRRVLSPRRPNIRYMDDLRSHGCLKCKNSYSETNLQSDMEKYYDEPSKCSCDEVEQIYGPCVSYHKLYTSPSPMRCGYGSDTNCHETCGQLKYVVDLCSPNRIVSCKVDNCYDRQSEISRSRINQCLRRVSSKKFLSKEPKDKCNCIRNARLLGGGSVKSERIDSNVENIEDSNDDDRTNLAKSCNSSWETLVTNESGKDHKASPKFRKDLSITVEYQETSSLPNSDVTYIKSDQSEETVFDKLISQNKYKLGSNIQAQKAGCDTLNEEPCYCSTRVAHSLTSTDEIPSKTDGFYSTSSISLVEIPEKLTSSDMSGIYSCDSFARTNHEVSNENNCKITDSDISSFESNNKSPSVNEFKKDTIFGHTPENEVIVNQIVTNTFEKSKVYASGDILTTVSMSSKIDIAPCEMQTKYYPRSNKNLHVHFSPPDSSQKSFTDPKISESDPIKRNKKILKSRIARNVSENERKLFSLASNQNRTTTFHISDEIRLTSKKSYCIFSSVKKMGSSDIAYPKTDFSVCVYNDEKSK